MPTNEDGEFELVLGNRQILSVFFIVVILLGVFFTMGYIVGGNSVRVTAEEARKPEPKPMVVDSASQPSTPAPAPESPATPPESAKSVPIRTAPQQPAEDKGAEKTTARSSERKESAAARPPVRQEKAAAPPPISSDHPASTYLQIAATNKREADIEVDVLRHKGFKAIDAEIPEKPGVFRVLVGPMEEGAVNKTKADLQAAGLPGDKAIKKIF